LIAFESAGMAIAGTYAAPATPRAAALILAGSGPIDRDGNVPKLRIDVSAAIAVALQAEGIATLRYDKRGVGASAGEYLTAGFTDNYADAREALAWLARRCPSVPVYVIGHSEGALHAAHLAADEHAAGAVLLGCPARTGEAILIWQAQAIIGTLSNRTKWIIKLLRVDPLKKQRKQFARFRSTPADVIRVAGRKMNARWFREFLDYDPAPVFRRVTVPILALTGGHDLQVPPEDVETIKTLVLGPCDARTVGDLSHLLRPDPETRGPRNYKQAVREPVSPEILTSITAWIGGLLAG
jgi:alpha/beta superfamily hydrolase